MDDIEAVLDAAGSQRAVILGVEYGGPSALPFAASHTQRVQALVLADSTARLAVADDYPMGFSPEELGSQGRGARRPVRDPSVATVTDLVAGSEIVFEDRGNRALKGISGEWQLSR